MYSKIKNQSNVNVLIKKKGRSITGNLSVRRNTEHVRCLCDYLHNLTLQNCNTTDVTFFLTCMVNKIFAMRDSVKFFCSIAKKDSGQKYERFK